MINLSIAPKAQNDLHDIKEYITKELESPKAALNIVSKITKRIRSLSTFPEIGARLDSIIDIETDYRILVCGNYNVFYRIVEKTIRVNRIIHGKRDYIKILFNNTNRKTYE